MDFEIWSMCQTSHGSWSEKKKTYIFKRVLKNQVKSHNRN